jgi:hypothetical protein
MQERDWNGNSPDSRKPRLTRILLIFGTALAATTLAWLILERLLASERGIDLSDEGLYLLAADPPSPSAAWGFPSGWHVRPLFALVNYDIASFRTLGAVILLASFIWLGWSAARATVARLETRTRSTIFLTCAAAMGGVGSLMFYAPMLRTPSYNWANLVGITVSTAAALTALSLTRSPAQGRSVAIGRTSFALLAGVSSLALFGTFPAKPTTLPLMLLLTTLLVLITLGARGAGAWALISVGLLPVWLALAYLLRVWPDNALEVFRLALDMPTPDPLQTAGPAIRAALLVPIDAVSSLPGSDPATLLALAIGLTVTTIPALAGREWIGVRVTGLVVSTIGALSLAGVPTPIVNHQFAPFRIANASVTTASLVLLIAAVVAASRRPCDAAAASPRALARWSTVGVLAVLPFVFAFGSGNGIYAQASLAAGTMLLAGIVAIPRPLLGRGGLTILITLSLAISSFAAGAVISGWQAPFRAAPITDQQVPTQVGPHGSTLLLEPRLSETISVLRSKAEAVGWTDETPIVDASYMWNPTIPYALGGRVPDFLALTIFGYSAAHDITDFHLSPPYRNFPYEKAWFVTSRPESITDPNGQAAVDFTMEKLSAVAGRAFPDSYACVAAGDFILWRPVPPEEGGQGCEG